MNTQTKGLQEVATFDTEFEAQIFVNMLADKGIEGNIWNINQAETIEPMGWVKVRVWHDDWEQARLLFEEKYPDKAEKTILIDGKSYISLQGKQCKHCQSTDVYSPEPSALQVFINALRYVFFLGSPRAYYCENCKKHAHF